MSSLEKKDYLNFQKRESFLSFLKNRGYSPKSIRIALEGVSDFWKNFEEMSKDTLLAYRDLLVANNKPSTVNIRVWAVNLYTKFLSGLYSSPSNETIKPEINIPHINPEQSVNDYLSLRWFPSLKNVPSSKRQSLENIISLEEYNTLKKYLLKNNKHEAYFLVRILAGTGMRPSEVLKITPNHIRKGYADIRSKRNKTRRIYFTDSLKLTLQEYYMSLSDEDRSSFNWDDPLFKMDLNRMSYIIRSEGARAGLRPEVCYPYSFRHMFGKMFMSRNSDISLLGDIMGHDSIETTRVYTRMTLDEQRAKVNLIVDWC